MLDRAIVFISTLMINMARIKSFFTPTLLTLRIYVRHRDVRFAAD